MDEFRVMKFLFVLSLLTFFSTLVDRLSSRVSAYIVVEIRSIMCKETPPTIFHIDFGTVSVLFNCPLGYYSYPQISIAFRRLQDEFSVMC